MLIHASHKVAVIAVLAVVTTLFFSNHSFAGLSINLEAIKTIESDGNPLAFNSGSKCYGLYQISEICLKDYNQINNSNYRPKDLFDPGINLKIAAWYFQRIEKMLNYYKIPASITTFIAAYNWGIGNVLKWHKNGARFQELPEATKKYIKDYQKLALTGSHHY